MIYKKIGSLIVMALLPVLASCDNFLGRSPSSQANTENFYRNAGDIEVAVIGSYAMLRSDGLYSRFWLYGDIRSDISEFTGASASASETNIEIFSVSSTNPELNSTWIDHYRGIAACNTVLSRMEGLEIKEPLANQYRGEALFLRSLMYFNLVRIFGDVPLVLEEVISPEGIEQPKDPASAVYGQIISNLGRAAQLLPLSYDEENRGRATSGAASALLGKVYLTVQDYPAAVAALEKVVNSGQYRLLDDYASVFDNDNALHDEAVFTVLYKADGSGHGSSYTHRFAPVGYSAEITGNQVQNIPTTSLLQAYEPADERRDFTVDTQYVNLTGETVSQRFNKKYLSTSPFPIVSDDDWPVLRYADVLLMYAEALNEMGSTPEAYEPLNRVRERAGLGPLSGLSQTEFREAVYHERMIELAFEGHRWFDLVRTGRAIEVMADAEPSYNIDEHQLIFPIPQAQIDVSGGILEQNPGY